MINEKNIIGEINVEVKAGLSVDEETARICMDLLAIHFKQCGAKGAVLKFGGDYYGGVGVQLLTSKEAVDKATLANLQTHKEVKEND